MAAIATIDDPLLIVACAGSGKTQVISQRIIEILRRAGVEPRNIVAFTFTEKAAAELKERVTNLVTKTFGNVIGLAELFIGTMHGYALDALQTHVAETFKYDVLNDIQTRLFDRPAQQQERADHGRRGRQRAAADAAALGELATVHAGHVHPA